MGLSSSTNQATPACHPNRFDPFLRSLTDFLANLFEGRSRTVTRPITSPTDRSDLVLNTMVLLIVLLVFRRSPTTVLDSDEEETPKKDGGRKKKENKTCVNESELTQQKNSCASSSFSSALPCIDELKEEFTCAICLEICFKPSTTLCGHSFCRTCLRSAADKCDKKCPKCRQLMSNGLSCTVNTVLWNTLQLLFPQEIEARKVSDSLNSRQQAECVSPETTFYNNLRNRSTHGSSRGMRSRRSGSGTTTTQEDEDAALARRLQRETDAALALRLQREELKQANRGTRRILDTEEYNFRQR